MQPFYFVMGQARARHRVHQAWYLDYRPSSPAKTAPTWRWAWPTTSGWCALCCTIRCRRAF